MADETLTANLNLTSTDNASGAIISGARRVRESLKEYERAVRDIQKAEKDQSSDAVKYFQLLADKQNAWAKLQRAQSAQLAEDTVKAQDKIRREVEKTAEKQKKAAAEAAAAYQTAGGALLEYASRYASVGAGIEAARRSFMAFADSQRGLNITRENLRLTVAQTEQWKVQLKELSSIAGQPAEKFNKGLATLMGRAGLPFEEARKQIELATKAALVSGTSSADWINIQIAALTKLKIPIAEIPALMDGWRSSVPAAMIPAFSGSISVIGEKLDGLGIKMTKGLALQLGAMSSVLEQTFDTPQKAIEALTGTIVSATDQSTVFGKLMQGNLAQLKAGQIDYFEFVRRGQDELEKNRAFSEHPGERQMARRRLGVDDDTIRAYDTAKRKAAELQEVNDKAAASAGRINKEAAERAKDAAAAIDRLTVSAKGAAEALGEAADAAGGPKAMDFLTKGIKAWTELQSKTSVPMITPGNILGEVTKRIAVEGYNRFTAPSTGPKGPVAPDAVPPPRRGVRGYATGGEFTVGGSGGTDTTPVDFMATPGEKVSIDPQGGRQDSLKVQQDKADMAMREHFARFHRSDRARQASLAGDLGGMYDSKGRYTGKGGAGGGGGDPAAGTRTGTGGGGGQASGTGGDGGPPGVPGVGGVPLNTPVGLDPASATGPAETLEDAYKRGYLKPPTAEAAAGGSPGQVVYQKLLAEFKNSSLIGKVPADGARFGIKTGSAEEWARFGTAVANEESSFRSKTVGPKSDPGGSYGIFQYAHGQVAGGNAFDDDASIKAFVRDATASSKNLASGILGRRISVISLKPERTIRSLPLAEKLAAGAKVGTTSAAPPITTAELGAALQGTTPAGDIRLGEKGAHGYTRGGVATEPWLVDTVRQASKALPEGYRAEVISTVDPRTTGTKWHPGGRAIDIQIYDKDNKPVTNVGKKEGTPEYAVYERMALAARQYAEQKYPDRKFIWGGHFNSGTPYDLMHFQSTGTAARGFSKQQLATPVIAPDDKTKVAGPTAISDIETRAGARYKAAVDRAAAAAAPAGDTDDMPGSRAAGKNLGPDVTPGIRPFGRTFRQEARRVRNLPYAAPAGEGRAAGKGIAAKPIVVRPVSAPGHEERAAGKGVAPAPVAVDDALAEGGVASAGGDYLVGERGPELLQMGGQSGSVISNANLRAQFEKPIEPIIRPRIQNMGPASMRWTRHAERNRDQDNTRRAAREAHTDLGFA